MKKIGEYTVRGTVVAGEVKRIQIVDGTFDTGFRIKKFIIATEDVYDREKEKAKLKAEDGAHK